MLNSSINVVHLALLSEFKRKKKQKKGKDDEENHMTRKKIHTWPLSSIFIHIILRHNLFSCPTFQK